MTTSIGLRNLFAAAAAFAVLALGVVAIDNAGAASSGGVGPAGTMSTEDGSTKKGKYARLWDRVKKRERRWANRTAKCESGKDPDAIGAGGRYRGAFQFMRSTWKSAPKSPGGDPIKYNYRTQAVVAVALKRKDGAGHWPNCG